MFIHKLMQLFDHLCKIFILISSVIGADIVDSTNQNIFKFGNLEQEDTWWELNIEQRTHFDSMRSLNSYLREEFHALQILLWKSGQAAMIGTLPAR